MLARLALEGNGAVSDEYLTGLLPKIGREIHNAKNYVRDAMNETLIAIGARSEPLRKRATDAAQRIGKVHVDHGDTGCKTPDAGAYIEKVWARRGARKK